MPDHSSHRISPGDRRRNEKLAELRAVVTRDSAALTFDLAANKQVCALTDRDSQGDRPPDGEDKAGGIPLAVTLTGGNRNDLIQPDPPGSRRASDPRAPRSTPPPTARAVRRPRLRHDKYRS